MSLIQDIPTLLGLYKDQKDNIAHDETLFQIYEGNLLPYIHDALKKQLSEKSYEQAIHRVAPINVLKRIIDKLSKIYLKTPQRLLEDGQAKDQDLFDWYMDEMEFDAVMTMANELFNLHKNVFIEPFLDQGCPRLRVIPASRFRVFSNDPVNPLRPTHLLKIMGTFMKDGEKRVLFYAYTDTEFLAFDDKGNVVPEKMADNGGQNIYGKIPGVYVNRSKFELIPPQDTDTLAMSLLIPVILTDVNFAHMFTSFPILYGVDVSDEGLKRSPNAFWSMKSDPASQKEPKIGVLEPGLNVESSLNLLKSTMAFWMQCRNIKPGGLGELNVEGLASGVAKVIDEMDTSEDRQKQVPPFECAEEQLWDLIINHMHPVWMRDTEFKYRTVAWTKGVTVEVEFSEQRPVIDSSKAIADQKLKIDMAIQDRFGAMQELYPDWSEDQIKEYLARVDASRKDDMAAQNPQAAAEAQALENGTPNSEQLANAPNQSGAAAKPGNAGAMQGKPMQKQAAQT